MLKMKKKLQKGDSVEAYFTRVNVCDCSASCVILCNCRCTCPTSLNPYDGQHAVPYVGSYQNEKYGFEGNTDYLTAH